MFVSSVPQFIWFFYRFLSRTAVRRLVFLHIYIILDSNLSWFLFPFSFIAPLFIPLSFLHCLLGFYSFCSHSHFSRTLFLRFHATHKSHVIQIGHVKRKERAFCVNKRISLSRFFRDFLSPGQKDAFYISRLFFFVLRNVSVFSRFSRGEKERRKNQWRVCVKDFLTKSRRLRCHLKICLFCVQRFRYIYEKRERK